MERTAKAFLFLLLIPLWAAREANGGVLHVASNGTDSATCGTKHDPCRSISRGIANANSWDRILVGPGRYGDANNNGFFGDSGDEAPELGLGCFCMLNVNKRVRIESEEGNAATVIDVLNSSQIKTVVQISASEAVFGAPGHGFSISAGGVATGIEVVAPHGVIVAGNRIVGTPDAALRLAGYGHMVFGNIVTGLSVGVTANGSGHRIEGNAIEANGSTGMQIAGSDHRLEDNMFVANRGHGLEISGSGHVIRRNAFLGNYGAGIISGFPIERRRDREEQHLGQLLQHDKLRTV